MPVYFDVFSQDFDCSDLWRILSGSMQCTMDKFCYALLKDASFSSEQDVIDNRLSYEASPEKIKLKRIASMSPDARRLAYALCCVPLTLQSIGFIAEQIGVGRVSVYEFLLLKLIKNTTQTTQDGQSLLEFYPGIQFDLIDNVTVNDAALYLCLASVHYGWVTNDQLIVSAIVDEDESQFETFKGFYQMYYAINLLRAKIGHCPYPS
jgi:hypothetical protein